MVHPRIKVVPAVAGVLIAFTACSISLPPDLDREARSAQVLELGAWQRDELSCREDKGDCNDWYRFLVSKTGRLQIEMELKEDEEVRLAYALRASHDLNCYDGQPHVVVLGQYPLSSALGFEEMSVQNFLHGAAPPGTVRPRLQVTGTPNEERMLRETIQSEARQIGIVADYYRSRGEPVGSRKLNVNATCGTQTFTLTLAPRDLLVEG